jgi:hypothetical protein
LVDGHVPGPPEFGQTATVPPVLVELSVTEPEELGDDVHGVVKEIEEADDPEEAAREGQFEQLMRKRRGSPG